MALVNKLARNVILILMFSTASTNNSGSDEPAHGSKAVTPYGSWKSPITAATLVEGSVRLGDTALDGDTIYWIELRPQEEGRCVIVKKPPDEEPQDVLPPPYSARTTAHEYGGGAFTVARGTVYFANYHDQRVYSIDPRGVITPVTEEAPQRFADFVYDHARDRIIAVCEDHGRGGGDEPVDEPVNEIVAIALDGTGHIKTLAAGCDFYSSPCINSDSTQLAWLSWIHPNMPWDGTELYAATFQQDGLPGETHLIAGGMDESIFQPVWSPNNVLYFISDRSNWWNIYRYDDGKVEQVTALDAEFGMPQWIFGLSAYAFSSSQQIVARYSQCGQDRLIRIDTRSKQISPIQTPYTSYESLRTTAAAVYAIASAPQSSDTVVKIDLESAQTSVIRRSSATIPDPNYTSLPEPIEFPTTDNETSHAFYYPPTNRDFDGPTEEAPPLLTIIHGGPTSATTAVYSAKVQYWTSRGFGVCDVNYRGSTGYGRAFRNRLRGNWGVVDVADAAHAAKFLADQGRADPKKLLIRGGSAGGYTTLAALAFHNVFVAGASYYGVSDLSLLAEDTHKFESRYLDQLVGPYPAARQVYDERSPIRHLDRFTEPVILFQGLEDRVVPPNQTEAILAALQEKKIPVAYVAFEDEQHGFRKAENIIRCHESELYFYGKILGFRPADSIEPVTIHGL